MEQKINLNINDGESFFAHEISINFSPIQFILDFKNITPRIDARSKEAHTLALKHNVIMMDPWQAKQFIELLNKAVSKYEEQFGELEKPKALKKLEEKAKQMPETKKDIPTYLG